MEHNRIRYWQNQRDITPDVHTTRYIKLSTLGHFRKRSFLAGHIAQPQRNATPNVPGRSKRHLKCSDDLTGARVLNGDSGRLFHKDRPMFGMKEASGG
jgi:DNA primase